jgi:hypothetical protein
MKTTTTPIIASYTKWDDQWAVRTNRKLTKEDYKTELRPVLGGGMEPVEVCEIEVTTKSGETRNVEIAEYEKSFGDSHIYSIR